MGDWRIAWAAGFLDGEGCFQAHQRKDNPERYAVSITASQARHVEPLERLRDVFGGNICQIKALRENQSPAWRWSADGATAVRPVLLAVLPFLSNKRAEAETLLMIAGLMPPRGKQRDVTPEQRTERHRLAKQLRQLKRVVPCPA